MIQSAVEELHASGPAHSAFFSTLFCAGAAVVKAFAAEQRGNVIDPSRPHCYERERSAPQSILRAVMIFFSPVLLDFSDPDTDQMGFFLPTFLWNAGVSQSIGPFFKLLLKTQEATCKYTNSIMERCLNVSARSLCQHVTFNLLVGKRSPVSLQSQTGVQKLSEVDLM